MQLKTCALNKKKFRFVQLGVSNLDLTAKTLLSQRVLSLNIALLSTSLRSRRQQNQDFALLKHLTAQIEKF